LPAESASDASAEAQQLSDSQEVTERRKQREAEATEAAEADSGGADGASTSEVSGGFAKPTEGRLTSRFGARWGTSHNGIDIAAPIGTPIYAVADGTVIEAGPASGFGLWVRIQHTDGTVSVYGHMNSFSVSQGQQVSAGEQIAEVGNRGFSTGPHLHLEIWTGENGGKIDPLGWLASRGISI
jgi:murein DD-endopeptidase MepM/ murein hydrolase activator NlpD